MLGRPLNCNDISSTYCQRQKCVVMERLDEYDHETECWKEILIPDQTCTPADLAASRIDFPMWLATLKPRDRRIALKLGSGETTSRVSRQHRISPERVSQIRRELHTAWCQFQGEEPEAAAVPA